MRINMSSTEIILIIIGIIIIVISCILVDRNKEYAGNSSGNAKSNPALSRQEEEYMKDRINEILAEIKEEAIVKVDDSLSMISNEKIMAVSEFSDQILEKIKRNHEEVVFLYNMLNDKEKELKSAVREIDASKQKLVDILETSKQTDKIATTRKAANSQAGATTATAKHPVTQVQRPMPAPDDNATKDNEVSNNNSDILELYSQGKSVLEISKLLGIGQGEVKLVIDLFKGKK